MDTKPSRQPWQTTYILSLKYVSNQDSAMPETPKLVSGRLNTEDGMVESVEGGTQTHQRGRRTLSGRRVFARPKTC